MVLLLAVANAPVRADTSVVVPPLPLPGPYPVACSNVSQAFSRLAPGEPVQAYWEGIARDDGTSRYVTDLLSDPANTLALTVNVPSDGDLYGSFAGHAIAYVVLVCYPTAPDNPRPVLRVADRFRCRARSAEPGAPFSMRPGAFRCCCSPTGRRGPVVQRLHNAIAVPASYGYVVAAPFHGDARILNPA
jgi:hypothetical protein